MLPTDFDESNKIYTKPEGWDDDQCLDLPVQKGNLIIDDKGTRAHALVSCWRLSKEDLEEIQRTGVIWLSVIGYGMPPVSLHSQKPYQESSNEA